MKPVVRVTGRVAVLDRPDVDTDQIIPKQFLKRIERTGYGEFLFFDWRLDEAGAPRPEFELNRPEYAGASVLIAGRNFGCGSSREHAAWALQDYGFDVIIAPSFGDIFRTNAGKNGMVVIELADAEIEALVESVDLSRGSVVTVDLGAPDDHGAGRPHRPVRVRRDVAPPPSERPRRHRRNARPRARDQGLRARDGRVTAAGLRWSRVRLRSPFRGAPARAAVGTAVLRALDASPTVRACGRPCGSSCATSRHSRFPASALRASRRSVRPPRAG